MQREMIMCRLVGGCRRWRCRCPGREKKCSKTAAMAKIDEKKSCVRT